MNRIISYRGLLADGGQNTINLHTNDGKTGYKIVKFQLFPKSPGSADYENVVKIYKVTQTSIDATVDFTDNTLLGAGYVEGYSGNADTDEHTVVFDNETFNQDIYITNKDVSTGENINYYIELEQVDLTEDQALVAIIKNLRNEQ